MLKKPQAYVPVQFLNQLLVLCFVFASGHFAGAAIFGQDDRISINEQSKYYSEARSTAVAVLSTMYTVKPSGRIDFLSDPLEDRICSSERFGKDTSLAWACTGFLVAPDILATAGHCMVNHGETKNETAMYCDSFSWLFGYNESVSGADPLTDVDPDNFYHCSQVIYAVREEKAPFRDFALVQLDRPVVGRTPLSFSKQNVDLSDELYMVGYPLGSPAKASVSARVMHNDMSKQSFMANLDALPGNSGSPVMNGQGEVVGILIGGTPMTFLVDTSETNEKGETISCELYNRCDENGENCLKSDDEEALKKHHGIAKSGSDVQRIEPVVRLLQEFENSRREKKEN